ncbi:MAG: hypothetical protein Lm2023SU_27030 [Serratia ureilytica]
MPAEAARITQAISRLNGKKNNEAASTPHIIYPLNMYTALSAFAACDDGEIER